MKKLTLYIVAKTIKSDNENGDKILTITRTKNDANEYMHAILKKENFEHFNSWCIVHKLDNLEQDVWYTYLHDVLSQEIDLSAYKILKVKYTHADIATVFRMFNNCEPLAVSFTDPVEVEYFILKHKEVINNDESGKLKQ